MRGCKFVDWIFQGEDLVYKSNETNRYEPVPDLRVYFLMARTEKKNTNPFLILHYYLKFGYKLFNTPKEIFFLSIFTSIFENKISCLPLLKITFSMENSFSYLYILLLKYPKNLYFL